MGWFAKWKQNRQKSKITLLISQGEIGSARALAEGDSELKKHLGDCLLDSGLLGESQALLGSKSKKSFLSELLAAVPAEPVVQTNVNSVLQTLDSLHQKKQWEALWDLADSSLEESKTATSNEIEEMKRYRSIAISHLEGAENANLIGMLGSNFDASAGENYLIIARALMNKSPILNLHIRLLSAADEMAIATQGLQLNKNDVLSLIRKGSAHLRFGETDEALTAFSKAQNLSPRNFAAVAGTGAAKIAQQERTFERIQRLPDVTQISFIEEVFPDWPVLTNLEKRLVVAGVKPLQHFLPTLASAGHKVRIVPIDVRVTQLPEFSALHGRQEKRDQRSWDSIGGLAGDGLACVKVEEIVNLDGVSFTLAHEFAHLIHEVVGSKHESMILATYEKAKDNEFAFDQYQLSNHHEFFAVSYTMWLARKYGLPLVIESDSEGYLERALSMFDRLSASRPLN